MRLLPRPRITIARLMLAIALAAPALLAALRLLASPPPPPVSWSDASDDVVINEFLHHDRRMNRILDEIERGEPLPAREMDVFAEDRENRGRVAYAEGRWDVSPEDVLKFALHHPAELRRPYPEELPRAFLMEFASKSRGSARAGMGSGAMTPSRVSSLPRGFAP